MGLRHTKRGGVRLTSTTYPQMRYVDQIPKASESHLAWRFPASNDELRRALIGLQRFLAANLLVESRWQDKATDLGGGSVVAHSGRKPGVDGFHHQLRLYRLSLPGRRDKQ